MTVRADELPLIPDAWLERLEVAEDRYPNADRVEPGAVVDDPGAVERARRFLETTAPAVSGRGGNNHTYATAALLRSRFALSEETAGDLLLDVFNPRCEPPWEADELLGIVDHAYRYAKRPVGHEAVVRPELFEGLGTPGEAGGRGDGPEPWPVIRASALRAQPPLQWIVRDFLPERAMMQWFGATGTYKSFSVLDLLLRLALGWDWAGQRVMRPHRVLYVAGEGEGGISTRVRAWEQKHGVTVPDSHFGLLEGMPQFVVRDEDHRRLVARMRLDGTEVVAVDTQAKAMPGLNENDAGDYGRFIDRCAHLVRTLGASTIAVHHTGKDEKRGARGSSAGDAGFDTQVRSTLLVKGQFRVDVTKQKDGRLIEPAGFETDVVTAYYARENAETGRLEECEPLAPGSQPRTSLVVRHTDRPLVSPGALKEQWREAALDELRHGNYGGEIRSNHLTKMLMERLEVPHSAYGEMHDYTRRTMRSDPRLEPHVGDTGSAGRVLSWRYADART